MVHKLPWESGRPWLGELVAATATLRFKAETFSGSWPLRADGEKRNRLDLKSSSPERNVIPADALEAEPDRHPVSGKRRSLR
jgi:hypothetical protein